MGIEQFLQQRFIKQGIELGIEIGAEKTANEKNLAFTKELLTNTDFNLEKIADMVGVPVSFVAQVKAGLH